MSVNLFRTPGTTKVPGCAVQCAHHGSRRQLSTVLSLSMRSVCADDKLSRNVLSSVRDRAKRGSCQAAAVAAWTSTPLVWLKNQISKEVWVQITSCLSSLTAFVICMILPVMIGTVLCIWRFHVREERRRIAQEQRREEGIQWVQRKVRRALVLAQDLSELRLVSSKLSASEAARDRHLAQRHARSLACTASPGVRNNQHVSGRMLCTCFREFAPDNWRLQATGKALYKTVHKSPSPAPVPVAQESPEQELKRLQEVEHQIARQFYSWDAPMAGESDFERVKRIRKLAGSDLKVEQLATAVP